MDDTTARVHRLAEKYGISEEEILQRFEKIALKDLPAPLLPGDTVASRIRYLRRMSGKKQSQAADSLGWNLNTLASYEAGARRLSLEKAASLAKHYGVSLDWIAGNLKTKQGKTMCEHCQTCGDPMENLLVFSSNVGFPDEVHECFGCHADGLLHETLTACMNCGSTFSADHLLKDPVSGEKNICPYCSAVWSEQRRHSIGRT